MSRRSDLELLDGWQEVVSLEDASWLADPSVVALARTQRIGGLLVIPWAPPPPIEAVQMLAGERVRVWVGLHLLPEEGRLWLDAAWDAWLAVPKVGGFVLDHDPPYPQVALEARARAWLERALVPEPLDATATQVHGVWGTVDGVWDVVEPAVVG